MKQIITFAIAIFLGTAAFAQENTSAPDPKKKILTVEASCGQCQFGMKDKRGCDLAIRIDGKSYFVEGTKIDEHGDAHADDGFCSAIRKAQVQGKVDGNKFKVSYFKLLPLANPAPAQKSQR